MASNAVIPTLEDAEARGLSDGQAVTLAMIAAGAEYFTETIGIDAFLGDPKNALLFIGKNMIAEGAEEGLSNIINTVGDALVAGGSAKIATRVSELMESEGLDENAAFGKAFGEWVLEAGLDTLAGAI